MVPPALHEVWSERMRLHVWKSRLSESLQVKANASELKYGHKYDEK